MTRKKLIASAPSEVAKTVVLWEQLTMELHKIANSVAVTADGSPEVVKASLLVAAFIANRAAAVRKEYPKEFALSGDK